jgi:hypothetical protein
MHKYTLEIDFYRSLDTVQSLFLRVQVPLSCELGKLVKRSAIGSAPGRRVQWCVRIGSLNTDLRAL